VEVTVQSGLGAVTATFQISVESPGVFLPFIGVYEPEG
jgi:hypothetical protein